MMSDPVFEVKSTHVADGFAISVTRKWDTVSGSSLRHSRGLEQKRSRRGDKDASSLSKWLNCSMCMQPEDVQTRSVTEKSQHQVKQLSLRRGELGDPRLSHQRLFSNWTRSTIIQDANREGNGLIRVIPFSASVSKALHVTS